MNNTYNGKPYKVTMINYIIEKQPELKKKMYSLHALTVEEIYDAYIGLQTGVKVSLSKYRKYGGKSDYERN